MRYGILICWIAIGVAGFPSMLKAREVVSPVEVNVSNGQNGIHTLTGEFSIEASTSSVWETLTDYEHMSDFVSSVNSSRKVEKRSNGWVVEQSMTGQAGFFHKKIYLLLGVVEEPGLISFIDISMRSFKTYSGSWKIQPENNTVKVVYRLEAVPAFFSPDFIAVGAFKRGVALLLEEVRNEIARRNKWTKT